MGTCKGNKDMSKDVGEHCGRCGANPDYIIKIWHYDLCYHSSHKIQMSVSDQVLKPNRQIEHRYCTKCRDTTMIDSCNHK